MATANALENIALGSLAKMLLDCLREHMDSERSDHTTSELNNYTWLRDGTDNLSLTQLRGFRRELMIYYNQPNEAGRILRVVRRLQAKEFPVRLLGATAIPLAACLLLDNPRVDVKHAGMELVRKWMQQFDGDPILSESGGPPSATYKKMIDALSLWQSRITNAINHPSPGTEVGKDEQGPLEVTKETVENAAKAVDKATKAACKKGPEYAKTGLPFNADKENAVYFLGTAVENSLNRLCSVEAKAKAAKRHFSSEESEKSGESKGADRNLFDTIAVVLRSTELDASQRLACPDHDELWMMQEFLAGAQTYLQLDQPSQDLLSAELQSFQTMVMGVFHRVAMNHVVRVLGESYLRMLENRATSLETALAMNDFSMAKARPRYLEDLKSSKHIAAGLAKLLKREVHLQCDDFVKSSIQFLHPIKVILEMLDPSGNLPRNLPSLLNAPKEVASLRPQINTLSADLVTSRLAEQNSTSRLSTVSIENKKLQKAIEVERNAMNKKYFSDIEAQVEARLQSEKTKSAAYISDIEAKAKRVDAAEEALVCTQEALKNVTRERDALASRNMDLDAACKQLRAVTGATKRGYEQMRRAKEECEVKLAIVEADLSHTQAQLQDFQTQTLQAPVPKTDENSKPHAIAQTGISVLTHREQLTAADRLDMIAQRWRNDLFSAEAEKQECSNALQATEDQIAAALQRLRELAPVKNPNDHYHNHNTGQYYRRRTRGRTLDSSASRTQSRSRTPVSDDSHSAVLNQSPQRPESVLTESPTRGGIQAQTVSSKLFGTKSALITTQEGADEQFPPLSKPTRPVRGSPVQILRLR